MKTIELPQQRIKGILAGEKLVMRFPITGLKYPCNWIGMSRDGCYVFGNIEIQPITQIGDILAGTEEWRLYDLSAQFNDGDYIHDIRFKACPNEEYHYKGKLLEDVVSVLDYEHDWQNASTMPEEFSRIKLKVTDLGVQRLGDLTAEGMINEMGKLYDPHDGVRPSFIFHWNLLHPDHPYSPDLWTIWYKFELVKEES